MTFYFVYDLPNWLFGVLTVAVFVLLSLAALAPTRRWVRRQHRDDHSHNDIVGFYLAAVTVFYGITLGLLAVGTWTTYSDVSNKVDHEAETLSSLYRDIGAYPSPIRDDLRADLRAYTDDVINTSWPLQRQGIIPSGTGMFLDRIQQHMTSFKPADAGQQVLHAEAYKQFNDLVEARRSRLNSVRTGMPGSLWALVILGAIVTVAVTLFFDLASFAMHVWMTVLLAGLLGLMTFLIATLDNPFRGSVSVGPDALVSVYNQTMAPTAGRPALPAPAATP